MIQEENKENLINFFDWAKFSNEERKEFIRNNVEKILDSHEGETSGYIMLIFETKENVINCSADSMGLINSELLLQYLEAIGAINLNRPEAPENEDTTDSRYDRYL